MPNKRDQVEIQETWKGKIDEQGVFVAEELVSITANGYPVKVHEGYAIQTFHVKGAEVEKLVDGAKRKDKKRLKELFQKALN